MTRKRKMLIGAAVVVVISIVAVLLIVMYKKNKEEYREIKVYEVDGEASVERDNSDIIKPYENMQLKSMDKLEVFEESYVQLKMDEDKYMLVEPDTKLHIEATGTSTDSKTKIILDEGTIVNHIEKPLSDKSSYEVITPNSTMSVRGTTFSVCVYYDEEGVSHTILIVYEGKVECHLIYPDKTKSKEGRMFNTGQEVRIWSDEKDADYEEPTKLSYKGLADKVLEFLKLCIKERGANFSIILEEDAVKTITYSVTYMYDGKQWATASVNEGEYAKQPLLLPDEKGKWDYDFSTPVDKDLVIEWVELKND